MPKRKRESSKTKNKEKKKFRRIIYSSEEEGVNNEEHLEEGLPTNDLDDGGIASPTHLTPPTPGEQPSAPDDQPPAPPSPRPSPVPPPPLLESEETSPTADIDPELLQALGEFEPEAVEWGEDLHEVIAKRFQPILLNGLKKEVKDNLLKAHLFPKNVSFSKAPTLNPEISAMLTEASRNRDKRILAKQDQLGKALSALGKAMTAMLKKNPDVPAVLSILNDAGKLIADSHFMETDTRRSLVIPLVDKSLTEPFKDRKRDNLLFGEKLGDLVKDSRGIKRTGQYIQATASTSTSGLNRRGPPARGRQPRGGQSYHTRPGGQRYQYQYPSRQRAAQPPPPPRRYAPAPPARRPPPPPAASARPPPPADRS